MAKETIATSGRVTSCVCRDKVKDRNTKRKQTGSQHHERVGEVCPEQLSRVIDIEIHEIVSQEKPSASAPSRLVESAVCHHCLPLEY
jgi:hypothetical protein